MARPTSISRFQAPWSRNLKWISAVGTVLFGGGLGVLPLAPGIPPWPRVIAMALLAVTFGVCLLLAVRGYSIARGELLVHRIGGDLAIPLAGLRSVEVMPHAARSALRVCGNGGLFSFSGWFWNRRLGRFRMCATDPARTVVLHFGDRVWVVTPDRPEEFVREVEDHAGLRRKPLTHYGRA